MNILLRTLTPTLTTINSLRSMSSRKQIIAICQIKCTSDKVRNLAATSQLVRNATAAGAKFVFLPEACDYIETSAEASVLAAESLDGQFVTKCRELAAELNVWISVGSFHRRGDGSDPSKIYNTSVIVDDSGDIRSVSDKIHLFEANIAGQGSAPTKLREADFTHPGRNMYMPVETPIGILANCICYDLRYPQVSSLLVNNFGAQILSYPSVFTVPTGQAHWEVLLRARAIENQCYVVAAGQVGMHNEKRSSYGHSMVVDPWGRVIAECGEEEECFKIAEIDLDYLDSVRKALPIKEGLRSDLYLQIPLVTKAIDQTEYIFGPKIRLANSVVFLETVYCIAFVNLRPIVPGHIVIIPKKLRIRACDMTSEEAADLFHIARHIAKTLEKHYGATAINFGIQDGLDSGQSVEHVHMHVLPRRKGDFEKNDDVYERLKSHDKEDSGEFNIRARTAEEMADEAKELRKLFYF